MVFLGIDIGTSAVKAVLVDEREAVVGEASAPVPSSEPRPGWSEQNPEDWWKATETAVGALRKDAPEAFRATAAIGLSGQMHGVTLLDERDVPIRPSIIWNDGRGVEECRELEAEVPDLPRIAGVIAMPSFTAPKLRWLGKHEPQSLCQGLRAPEADRRVRHRHGRRRRLAAPRRGQARLVRCHPRRGRNPPRRPPAAPRRLDALG
jgi:xylulokinase